ncbi:MAG: F0F1 ATP synthase subunit A [Candidatus Omnitrophica bacterium]|nr:F0F1 ATP synthase subunit A [Candidatus Omnitrophota bacterium]
MAVEAAGARHELPNLVSFLADLVGRKTFLGEQIYLWENVLFSLLAVFVISLIVYLAQRKQKMIPERLQNAVELVVGGLDDFVCGILGKNGRRYTPFIGTLFIYIIFMNLFGIIPFMKSPTSSWSTTLGLALCVFVYVQYTAFKELGFLGYLDHMMGRPRGILAFSVFVPVMMFILHIVSELVRPISLSLRLRSNIWGDDMLLSVLAGFGLGGVPLLVFSTILAILAAVVQAVVFTLLTTIYFALVLTHEGEEHRELTPRT